ncbi:MAG: PfkB family carbohydrate kinase, partial [Chloroflexi bacterium]|nr:PfkB family carbohydrate kinase [Chloroflexota bacterium]
MITVVGSLLMDLAIRAPRLVQPGEVVHGHEAQYACGGRGANQATAVVRLGGRAGLIGVVGDDIVGAALLSAVSLAGVDARGVVRRTGAASGCFIVVGDPHGATQVVVANGANATLSATDVERHAGTIASSQALLVQLETSDEAVEAALRIARSAGVRTLLNAAPAFRCRLNLLPLCDVITVNEREA